MPVKLTDIPSPAPRPSPPRRARWCAALVFLLLAGTLVTLLSGESIRTQNPQGFWMIALGIPFILWIPAMVGREMVYASRHIWANGWDARRQKILLQEVGRGRRSLQILSSDFYTAFFIPSMPEPEKEQLRALLAGEVAIKTQSSFMSKDSIRHSHLPFAVTTTSEKRIAEMFSRVLNNIKDDLLLLPPETPLAVLLEAETSVSDMQLKACWEAEWEKLGCTRAIQLMTPALKGLHYLDDWLDQRIKDNAVLLVIALQIAPEQPELKAEVVVALLLGNRLTQKTLIPEAFLHRPEKSSIAELVPGIEQALDWVPVPSKEIQHVWLSGLSMAAYSGVVMLNQKPPLESVNPHDAFYNLDRALGNACCAAPWLAIAAATQIAQVKQKKQLILSSEPTSDESVWSVVVSPYAVQQESVS